MNQLSKVAVLVAGLALGSVVCAARVEVVGSGLYVTLPSSVRIETYNTSDGVVFIGTGVNSLYVRALSTSSSVFKNISLNNTSLNRMMETSVQNLGSDIKVLKKGDATLNGSIFKEYQITGTNPTTGDKIYSYVVYTLVKSSLVGIGVTCKVSALERNRKAIADIVGSISTKP